MLWKLSKVEAAPAMNTKILYIYSASLFYVKDEAEYSFSSDDVGTLVTK